jgi:beta-glucuronidase
MHSVHFPDVIMIIPLTLAIIGFLLLAAAFWQHLFLRNAFTPPSVPGSLQVYCSGGVPFLVENNLPYPAGIQTVDRQSTSLDEGWTLRLDGEPGTSVVCLPHCFNTAESPFREFEGIANYEREFSLPAWPAGSLVRLAFLGSFHRTEVWLDGQPLGSHSGGYLPFYFDLTPWVKPDAVHKLTVRVDNRLALDTLPQRLFPGHNPGWQPYGGLHRSVRIEICPPTYCFKLRLEADLEQKSVRAMALFHSPDGEQRIESVILSLVDPDGQPLGEAESALAWDPAGVGCVKYAFAIDAPRAWSPNSPDLYRLAVRTRFERCETEFGFRSLDAADGKLLLNGRTILLKGVCRHQEDRIRGLAQDADAITKELRSIRAMNGNFVRLAHYPHSAETLDGCDRLGLCVWEEIPLYQSGLGIIRFLFDKTRYSTGKSWHDLPRLFYGTNALENHALLGRARDELLKLIERDGNHPSVLFWGLGNECWTLHPSGAKALAWLRMQAESLDMSRLFSYAAFTLPYLGARRERAFDAVDVIGINEYFGWYYGKTDQAATYLEELRRRYPHKPLLVTETGADAVAGQHSRGPHLQRDYSEEHQAWFLESQWLQMRSIPTFAGLSVWVLKDFLCPEYREDNPVPYYNLKGLFNRDGQPKLAYERMKALYGEDQPDD